GDRHSAKPLNPLCSESRGFSHTSRYRRHYGRYFAGIGPAVLFGSHSTLSTRHRFPSFTACTLLMPVTVAFPSGVSRISYVLHKCAKCPYVSACTFTCTS